MKQRKRGHAKDRLRERLRVLNNRRRQLKNGLPLLKTKGRDSLRSLIKDGRRILTGRLPSLIEDLLNRGRRVDGTNHLRLGHLDRMDSRFNGTVLLHGQLMGMVLRTEWLVREFRYLIRN